MIYELFYRPTIQGRGEFVRLLLEEAGAAFRAYAKTKAARKYRRLFALHARVAERPRAAGYLDSPRRIPFNNDGIFRRYPELDSGRSP